MKKWLSVIGENFFSADDYVVDLSYQNIDDDEIVNVINAIDHFFQYYVDVLVVPYHIRKFIELDFSGNNLTRKGLEVVKKQFGLGNIVCRRYCFDKNFINFEEFRSCLKEDRTAKMVLVFHPKNGKDTVETYFVQDMYDDDYSFNFIIDNNFVHGCNVFIRSNNDNNKIFDFFEESAEITISNYEEFPVAFEKIISLVKQFSNVRALSLLYVNLDEHIETVCNYIRFNKNIQQFHLQTDSIDESHFSKIVEAFGDDHKKAGIISCCGMCNWPHFEHSKLRFLSLRNLVLRNYVRDICALLLKNSKSFRISKDAVKHVLKMVYNIRCEDASFYSSDDMTKATSDLFKKAELDLQIKN